MTFTAQQISLTLGGRLIGNADATVHDVAKIETAEAGTLCFLYDEKFVPQLSSTRASVVLISKALYNEELSSNATLIIVDNARAAMAQLLQAIEAAMRPPHSGIEQPCFVAEGVSIPQDAYIGAFTYIGKGAKIGNGVQIYPQCYIGENVEIGDGSIVYAGVKVYYNCLVGKGCVLHSGVVIGADGFGFEPDANGVLHKVPQIGNVVIEDDVEIGANTCVDRAVMGSTVIGVNSKLDNLVQVGHNVRTGRSNVMCAQVGVAGSTEIGSGNIFAGQVGVAGHITVGDRCVFGAQSGVAGSVKKQGTYMGSPAIDAMLWRRASASFKHLPEIMRITYRK